MRQITFTGRSRQLALPKAPKLATHAKIECTGVDEGGRAETTVKNFGIAFRGVAGLVQWGRYPSAGKKTFQAIDKPFEWNGFKVV